MVTFTHKGNLSKTKSFLEGAKTIDFKKVLDKYGHEGVTALRSATPVDSGLTADSWEYETKINPGSVSIIWYNSNVVDGIPIAILLQYGHGTRNGGYVQGKDYINPALAPLFEKMSMDIWKEVTSK